jgi:precorrin-6A/cobalt-precorrin-6A reductase
MRPKLLILAGTTEAAALARAVAAHGLDAVVSYAGRTAAPRALGLPQRVGGFGGAAGLAAFLAAEAISHVIDATHPFAARISANAVAACAAAGVPLVALTRPAWAPGLGDRWQRVPDIAGAVAALDRPAARVFLAIGRQTLEPFAVHRQHRWLLRVVDPPEGPLPLPGATVVVDRGPFDAAADRALMERHGIGIVVAKNAGGSGAAAKLAAARALGLPVVMIDRPAIPARAAVEDVPAVFDWLARHGADLGV